MAFTCSALPVLSIGPVTINSGCFGVVSQEDGSYLAGFTISSDDFPYGSSGSWYRSTNEGLTWSAAGTSAGLFGQTYSFPSNVASNIAIAPVFLPPTLTAQIARTTNHGSSWSTVFSVDSFPSPFGRSVNVFGVQSFNRTKAIAWGELDGDNTSPAHIYGLSTDAGASWTPQATWDAGDQFDVCNSMGIAEDSTIYAQYTKFGGLNRTSNFARSDDGAASWNVLSAPPGGAGTPPNAGWAITCFDKSHLAMVGIKGSSPTSSQPGAWWSDDAGASLNLLSTSDIINWPTGSFNTHIYEVKRLTRDACIIAVDQQRGIVRSPWKISLDQGHTYEIEVSQGGPGGWPYQFPVGKICVTRDGHILMPLWGSTDYDTANLEIWRGTVVC